MRNFVEIPGGKLKKAKGRFGGDNRHLRDDDDDLLPIHRRSRQERHAHKRQLRSAITSGEFESASAGELL